MSKNMRKIIHKQLKMIVVCGMLLVLAAISAVVFTNARAVGPTPTPLSSTVTQDASPTATDTPTPTPTDTPTPAPATPTPVPPTATPVPATPVPTRAPKPTTIPPTATAKSVIPPPVTTAPAQTPVQATPSVTVTPMQTVTATAATVTTPASTVVPAKTTTSPGTTTPAQQQGSGFNTTLLTGGIVAFLVLVVGGIAWLVLSRRSKGQLQSGRTRNSKQRGGLPRTPWNAETGGNNGNVAPAGAFAANVAGVQTSPGSAPNAFNQWYANDPTAQAIQAALAVPAPTYTPGALRPMTSSLPAYLGEQTQQPTQLYAPVGDLSPFSLEQINMQAGQANQQEMSRPITPLGATSLFSEQSQAPARGYQTDTMRTEVRNLTPLATAGEDIFAQSNATTPLRDDEWTGATNSGKLQTPFTSPLLDQTQKDFSGKQLTPEPMSAAQIQTGSLPSLNTAAPQAATPPVPIDIFARPQSNMTGKQVAFTPEQTGAIPRIRPTDNDVPAEEPLLTTGKRPTPAAVEQARIAEPDEIPEINIKDDPTLETIMRQAQMGLYVLPDQEEHPMNQDTQSK